MELTNDDGRIRGIVKFFIAVFSIAAVISIAAALYLMFSGPRMKYQYKVKTYSQAARPPDANAVPIEKARPPMPVAAVNPLNASYANIADGKVYYEYYCVFCHGENGRGDGEAGQSYVPRPADLSADRIRVLKDGEIYERMLAGAGHDPVLRRVVPQDARWFIVLYVRSLGNIAQSR